MFDLFAIQISLNVLRDKFSAIIFNDYFGITRFFIDFLANKSSDVVIIVRRNSYCQWPYSVEIYSGYNKYFTLIVL